MFARFTFLFAMFLGLAVAPVGSVAACAVDAGEAVCHSCCEAPEVACCEEADSQVPPASPAKTAPVSGGEKHSVAPVLVFAWPAPCAAVEPPAFARMNAARIAAQPVLEKTCIQLI